MPYFIAISTVIAISLYTLYPSFNLALFGDFWVTLWRYELMVGKFSIGVWNHFTYFHTLYGPLTFYFSGQNGEVTHNVLTFGFPSRIQLIYNLNDYKSIVTLASFEEVISAVTDGKSLIKHGLPEEPIPVESIYTFHLEGNDKLVNTTATTRDKLSQFLKR